MGRFIAPADLTYDDMDGYTPDSNPGIDRQLATAGREFVCGLYETYPGGLLRVLGSATKALTGHASMLDRMCRPLDKLPPPPTQAFVGGQCPGFAHYVRVNTTRFYVGGDGILRESPEQLGFDVVTPITDVRLSGTKFINVNGSRLKVAKGIVVDASALNAQGKPYPYSYVREKYDDPTDSGTGAITDISVDPNPADGMNCELQPPSYPDNPIPLVSITNNANITLAPNVNVSVPIVIVPTLIAPVFATVRPEINLNIGGVNVNFAPDGVRFTSPSDHAIAPDSSYDPREFPPDTVNIDDSTQNSANCDLQPVLNELDQIKKELEECCERDRPYPPPDASKVIITPLGNGNSGLFDLPPDTFQVGLKITDHPLKVKQQDGFGAPDVLYAGWAWFGAANSMSERMPVDSEFKLFCPPRYISNTFGFTLYNGLTATITAYSIKPKTP